MTPTNTDSPLRRSEASIFRENAIQTPNVTINDDEEERREARRRTIRQSTVSNAESTTFEDNETLKKCLEIYNGNKLSRENAWSLSLIDTLSTLLDRHHKSLNNFKVAGSSLEASSKVYGLRVDSIHTDVLRMSAGLNAQKFAERNLEGDDDDDAVATGGDDAADPNATDTAAAGVNAQVAPKAKPKPKRQRRTVSTITKNKETLNARLDTVPLQDPVFGKLNSIVGSINSSNRLMNNILLTTDSELRLRTTFRFWDSQTFDQSSDYTEEVPLLADDGTTLPAAGELAACDRLFKLERCEELKLRPLHDGYVISDTPEVIAEDKEPTRRFSMGSNFGGDDGIGGADDCGGDGGGAFHNSKEMSMAFDINADCEPMPLLSEQVPMIDVDFGDFDEITTEERTAINNCRGLRKAPVLIEDLRPVDASSTLEYSYRPIDKISQFWAGPSHWKFKRARTRPSTLAPNQHGEQNAGSGRAQKQRGGKRAQNQLAAKRSKQLNFGEIHDDLFLKLDDYKARKVNVQKKWDQRKLKLPTDLQIDPLKFYNYYLAPGLRIEIVDDTISATTRDLDDDAILDAMPTEGAFDDHFGDSDDGAPRCSAGSQNMMNVSSMSAIGSSVIADATITNAFDALAQDDGELMANVDDVDNIGNNTVLEIATEFEGAPSQVTKIIVPFAKRAKVIDMKNLKRACTQLLNKQMKRHVDDVAMPQHPIVKNEQYSPGLASFKEIYEHLPELLTKNMSEALSPSVAFYSVLHLANDFNLRLLPQDDLEDFKIRQVML